MNDDVNELSVEFDRFDTRLLVALSCAAAERVLGVYDQFGSGDPNALREAVNSIWAWVETGQSSEATGADASLLEEYVDVHFEEGDELMGQVVASALRCIAAYKTHDIPTTCALETARAFALNAEIATEIDVLLQDAEISPSAESEEQAWRAAIKQVARGWSGPIHRTAFMGPAPSWMPDFVATSR